MCNKDIAMPVQIPKNCDEANSLATQKNYTITEDIRTMRVGTAVSGGRVLKQSHIDSIKPNASMGQAIADCNTLSSGDKCFESGCIDNVITVLYCNGNECVRAVYIPC